MKKLLMLLFSLTMVFATATVASACDEEETETPCTEHVDEDSDGYCDVCDEEYEVVIKEVNVTFTVKDLQENTLSGITVFFKTGTEQAISAVSGADGKVSVTLKTLAYSVSYDYSSLGEGIYYLPETTSVTIADNTTALDLYLNNRTPNGSLDRPFTLDFGENTITIPANTSYYYIVYRSLNYYVVVNGENIKVTYSSTDYTPDSQGNIAIQLLGTSTNSADTILFSNTSDSEQMYTINISSAPGSQSNPYQLTLDQDITTKALESNTSVYYSFTATENGSLTITLKSQDSYITVSNTVSGENKNTEENNTVVIDVKEGQTVRVDCSVKTMGGQTASVVFSAAFTADTNE